MKILLACLQSDFGQDGIQKFDDKGNFINSSWEYENFYKAWKQLADEGVVELQTYWLDKQEGQLDKLVSVAKEVDLIFQIPVTHALGIHLPQAKKIIEDGTPIVSFHPDIHMRYDHPAGDRFVLSRVTEGYDTHTISPALHMMPILASRGVRSYHMPFGIPSWCNKIDDPTLVQHYDVTFVGQKHGIREQVIGQIRAAGIQVETWGHFWPDHKDHHNRPSCSEMVQVFNRSKINLNLRWCSRSPSYGQIKGRDFELLGCGAFMIASQHSETDDLHQLYEPKHQFAEYHYIHDMIDGIRFYLKHDSIRQAIADAAYREREKNLWTTRLKKFVSDWNSKEGWNNE